MTETAVVDDLVHTYTWDARSGQYEPVTDVYSGGKSSRIAGHVTKTLATAMLTRARKYMQSTKY